MSSPVVTMIEQAKVDAINREHRLCEQSYTHALDHAIECGRMLSAVKAELRHGEWLPWLERNFLGSERHAQRYIQIAAAPVFEDPTRVSDLSLRAALAELAKPKVAPKASRKELTASLSEMVDDDEDGGSPLRSLPAETSRAAEAEVTWTEALERRHQRCRDLVLEALDQLDQAATPGLSRHAVAELLRSSAVSMRQAIGPTEDLALRFER